MKYLLSRSTYTNTKWLYQETLGNNETQTPVAPTEVVSVEEFIRNNNEALNTQIASIPVDPKIQQLCGNQISALICGYATPDQAASFSQIEGEISNICNSSEADQFTNTENDPNEALLPQQIEAQRAEVQQAIRDYMQQVVEALKTQAQQAREEAADDPEKLAYADKLSKRGLLMQVVESSVSNMDWHNEIPFGGNAAVVGNAEKTIGIQEGTSEADALAGLDTNAIPWCGAYVKAMIEQSGEPLPEGPNWNVAETYVKQPSAAGQHVAIYCGGGMMIGGNQGNAVTKGPIPGNYRFNTVENLRNGIHADLKASGGEPQPGDIIVTSRDAGNSDPNATGPQ